MTTHFDIVGDCKMYMFCVEVYKHYVDDIPLFGLDDVCARDVVGVSLRVVGSRKLTIHLREEAATSCTL